MNFADSKDGLKRATIRVEHRVGSSEIAGALFVRHSAGDELTKTQALDAVREVALNQGSEGYSPDCGFDVQQYEDADEYGPRAAWAAATVRRLWPELDDEALRDFEELYTGENS